jgi:cytochrome c peroxidase
MTRIVSVVGVFASAALITLTAGAPNRDSGNPAAAQLAAEIKRVETDIDRIFADTLAQVPSVPADAGNRMKRVQMLGKLLLFDKQLSVNRNTACSFCHMPEVDFTGPISIFNATTVAYPGSVRDASGDPMRSRYGRRKPQSYTYAPYYPPLQYRQTQADFYGGNFWDLRATGAFLQNPSAEQAQGPPVDANEMGLPDTACVVRRLSQSPYSGFFETVWGKQAFAVKWPTDVDEVCGKPGPPPSDSPLPVHLSVEDRGRSNATYDQFALAIAAYEAAPDVSPFSSKFDYALTHADENVLTGDELAGWDLFRGQAKCNTCHLDGSENVARRITPGSAASAAPLFTDFTSANLGVPSNPAIPFFQKNAPDRYGYVANPAGRAFVDTGVGGFLRDPLANPNHDWARLAAQFDGHFQVSSLRNVDKRPRPDFVKAYMHNGYFKSLKEVVHFYNTRDRLPRCDHAASGEKTTCWPAPEVSQNIDTTVGNLGLTGLQEDQLVAFLKTLTDGYKPQQRPH